MDQQPAVPPSFGNPYKKWFFVLAIIFVLVVVGGIYFYSLVRGNVDDIESLGTTETSDGIATDDDPYDGNPDASIVIVEFSDFQCPYCFDAFPVIREVVNAYHDDIKFIFRDFPITSSHPYAQKAAEAGECAQAQGKFWEMHDKMFLNQNDLSTASLIRYADETGLESVSFAECLNLGQFAAEVEQDLTDGLLAGVDGTPTFFINGRKLAGTVSYDSFASVIEQLLAAGL